MMLLTKLSCCRAALLAALLLAACAPADLDITPTATLTAVPTPTQTATPLPVDFVDPNTANQAALDIVMAALPARLPAGAVEWRRDTTRGTNGVEALLNLTNGVGGRAYYTEQTGGQMNLSFAFFNSPADTGAHYVRMRDVVRRGILETGRPNDTFPQPNVFGSGLYGSVAIFQIDNVFIEVNIELFSSTQANPLVPLARETMRFFDGLDFSSAQASASDAAATPAAEAAAATEEASITGHPLLDAVLARLPEEIAGDAIWRRDMERSGGMETPPGLQNGTGVRIFYREQTGGALQVSFDVFESAEAAQAQYERIKGIREGLGEENERGDEFPQPHIFGQGRYGSVALFQIDTIFVEVLIELSPGNVPNPIRSIAQRMLTVLEEARTSVWG